MRQYATPLTRDNQWVTEMNRVYGDYFGQRPSIVLTQCRPKHSIPTNSTAPTFNQLGGNVTNGFQVTMSAPAGTIYLHARWKRPALLGEESRRSAFGYSAPLALTQAFDSKHALVTEHLESAHDATFYIIQQLTGLLITEIMYHPPSTTNINGDQFEFVELKNVSGHESRSERSALHQWHQLHFPVGSFLAPGHFVVACEHPAAFTNRYPAVHVVGVYSRQAFQRR